MLPIATNERTHRLEFALPRSAGHALYITLAFSLVLSFLLWPRSKGATPDRVP